MKKALLLLSSCLLFIISCEPALPTDEFYNTSDLKAQQKKGGKLATPDSSPLATTLISNEDKSVFENLRKLFLQDDPSLTCSPTKLTPIVMEYRNELISDPVARDNYNLYVTLNRTLALKDTREQYFGKTGEHTKLVQKRIRELERFWDMRGEIQVKGQHTETLNNRDILATHFYNMLMDERYWEDAYIMADAYIELNNRSPLLPESPLLASDGFTNNNKTILIGDGLIQLLSETGIDSEIIWTGILAHEWSHQIQIDHAQPWYNSTAPTLEAPVVETELEADFFAAYFLTHKRGATYNWKRVEQFLDLFFQSGDCDTWNPGHHGTPEQRLLASRLGYELADSAQKQGHILSPDQVHAAFIEILPQLLE